MKATNTALFRDVFELVMKQRGLWKPYTEAKIVNMWPEIVGKTIARHTSKVEIRDGVMVIRISSSVVRNELLMLRTQLTDVVNQKAGFELIRDVVVV